MAWRAFVTKLDTANVSPFKGSTAVMTIAWRWLLKGMVFDVPRAQLEPQRQSMTKAGSLFESCCLLPEEALLRSLG